LELYGFPGGPSKQKNGFARAAQHAGSASTISDEPSRCFRKLDWIDGSRDISMFVDGKIP
jgi:hypothetical protein